MWVRLKCSYKNKHANRHYWFSFIDKILKLGLKKFKKKKKWPLTCMIENSKVKASQSQGNPHSFIQDHLPQNPIFLLKGSRLLHWSLPQIIKDAEGPKPRKVSLNHRQHCKLEKGVCFFSGCSLSLALHLLQSLHFFLTTFSFSSSSSKEELCVYLARAAYKRSPSCAASLTP